MIYPIWMPSWTCWQRCKFLVTVMYSLCSFLVLYCCDLCFYNPLWLNVRIFVPTALLVKNICTLIFSPFSGDTRFLRKGGGGGRGKHTRGYPACAGNGCYWDGTSSQQKGTVASFSCPAPCCAKTPYLSRKHDPYCCGPPAVHHSNCMYLILATGGLLTI